MAITPEDVVSILTLAENSSCESLDIEIGDFKLSYRQSSRASSVVPLADPAIPAQADVADDAPAPTAEPARTWSAEAVEITAPMVGTFYHAPAPGEPPFVEVGTPVKEDTILCIIEVMKVMNPIKAGCLGRVAHIAVANAGTIEFGQLLIVIEPT